MKTRIRQIFVLMPPLFDLSHLEVEEKKILPSTEAARENQSTQMPSHPQTQIASRPDPLQPPPAMATTRLCHRGDPR
jgi:hypothetical protein